MVFMGNSAFLGWLSTMAAITSLHLVERAVSSPEIRNEVQEFCQFETMQARCRWNSEVIVMTSARWGRMRAGRCLEVDPDLLAVHGNNPLYLGCSVDVLHVLDGKCSGRSACDVRIQDPDLEKIKPCYKELARYIEVSYECVKVVQETRSCVVPVTSEPQYISSNTTSNAGLLSSCGSVTHPWRLEAAAGQRINISIIDFAASAADLNGPSRDVGDVIDRCGQYGYVVEKSNKKNVALCAEGGAEQRERAVYTSETNNVDIVLTAGRTHATNIKNPDFLIRIQAVGCTNVVPPDNAWLKRSNNDIIIGCYSSQQTWRLKCDGHDWKGTIGTCPELYVGRETVPVEEENSDEIKIHKNKSTQVLTIMIVIAAAALIVCVTIVTVGCMCLTRYKRNSGKKMPTQNNGSVRYATTNSCDSNVVFTRGAPVTAAAGTQLCLLPGQQQQQMLPAPTNYNDELQDAEADIIPHRQFLTHGNS